MSLIGTLVLQTAENLALITVAQCVEEGCPVIMGGAAGPMDMRSGALAYGAPERSLLIAANNQIQRFYGLPTHAASIATNTWQPDVQTGRRTHADHHGAHADAAQLVGRRGRPLQRQDRLPGAGGRSTFTSVRWRRACCGGINTADELWSVDEIEKVGPGGSYLTAPSTLRLHPQRRDGYLAPGQHGGGARSIHAGACAQTGATDPRPPPLAGA